MQLTCMQARSFTRKPHDDRLTPPLAPTPSAIALMCWLICSVLVHAAERLTALIVTAPMGVKLFGPGGRLHALC